MTESVKKAIADHLSELDLRLFFKTIMPQKQKGQSAMDWPLSVLMPAIT